MRSLSTYGLSAILLTIAFALLPQAASAAQITVNIADDSFSGKTIDINPGDTVTWINTGSMAHTVTADNGSFDSGSLAPRAQYSQTFTQAGNYPYYCKFHGGIGGQGMSGLVRVAAASTAVPTGVYTQQPIQTVVQPTTTYTNTYTPTATTNTTVTTQAQNLLSQVIQLQQLLAQLQAAKNAGGGTTVPTYSTNVSSATCPRIGRSLKPGMSGDDVTRLQQYLATDPSVYPEATITGYFGSLTQAAVQRWQIKYNIVASGDPASTGFGMVGPRTAAAIALQCSTATTVTNNPVTTPVVDPNAATVGALIQVTPVTGDAPLSVTAQVTVNTVSSCIGALYLLDWGDGTAPQQIAVSGNTCAQVQQSYAHLYQYGGQYVVKVSSQGSQATAVLLVNGPAAPAPGTPTVDTTTPTITVTSPSGGQNLGTGQTLAISWQSAGSIPSGSNVVLDLYDGSGNKVVANDLIAITSYTSGAVPWVIPSAPGVVACPAVYPSGLCGTALSTGSYKIRATLYGPSTQGNTFGPLLATDDSSNFTIIAAPIVASSTLPAETFTASAVSGAAPLQVSFAGTVTSADAGWSANGGFDLLTYGDGGSDFITLPTAANSSVNFTSPHTYQTAGSYTATLYQGQTAGSARVGTPITITATGAQASSYSYGPLYVGPAVNGNALSASAAFDIPSSCTGYDLSWGDGSSDIVQSTTTGCAQTATTRTFTHQYPQAGSYNILLRRGATLSQQDPAGIVIQN